MKTAHKVIIQFFMIEICSLLFGVLLAMRGAGYNGRFMVTDFMGNLGWEAGAVFYGLNLVLYDHQILALSVIQLYFLPTIGALIGINWHLIWRKINFCQIDQ